MMKLKFGTTYLLVGCLLAPMAGAYADNVDNDHPMNLVKDSAITAAIKTKLAAEHLPSLKDIKVDTDDKGVVWLSGSTDTQTSINKAGSIARNTDGVIAVKNQIIVKSN
ncbi:BON domain-containing protein [Solimicrobium silvestre]|uniref:BON domain n=1 Tax=Solimicrobium silvestre TaxID=2099400 RepID=A0A2S9H2W2_9BURK|nr:BON domain-containing protein [Solimicrobium silvestre]PRC94322.1 BON domain [Solimicrobium silvestre]